MTACVEIKCLFMNIMTVIAITNCFAHQGEIRREQNTNQRTNGPLNAHLISGPIISTKHTKPG